jgi:hypothetical protein
LGDSDCFASGYVAVHPLGDAVGFTSRYKKMVNGLGSTPYKRVHATGGFGLGLRDTASDALLEASA